MPFSQAQSFEDWLLGVSAEERSMLEAMPDLEREDAFYRDIAFGTGGLRGKLGLGPNRMNSYTVGKCTQGLADWLNANLEAPTVALCRDTRHGSEEFVRRAASVLAANGIRSYMYERVEPTPALSFAVRELGCSAGVNITASHNPAAYNGYKVYGADGCQITVAAAEAIQAAIDAVNPFDDVNAMPYDEVVGRGLALTIDESVIDKFVDLAAAQATGVDCSGLRVAYTPLHGVGLECVSRALAKIGVADVHVVEEQAVQDGAFPTCPYPNPEVREALGLGLKLCEGVRADLLLATDPDCDRLGIAVPHAGEMVLLSGNELGLLLLDMLAERAAGRGEGLSRRVALTTVVSAPMADDLARKHGFELRRTLTGFKFIGEQIGLLESQGREEDFLFGFEESYGYLAGSHVRDKDAVVASVLVCELAAHWKARGLDLYEAMQALYRRHGFWSNALLSKTYEGPEGAAAMASIMEGLRENPPREIAGLPVEQAIDYAAGAEMPVVNPSGAEPQALPPSDVLELRLAGGSRVLVRPSGTEPKVKAYLFARSKTTEGADSLLIDMSREIESILGANKVTHLILLSGGSGTRLWPLSNSSRSKQFLKVLRDAQGNHVSMVQRVFSQIRAVDADLDVTIATCADQEFSIRSQVEGDYALVLEPGRRDTAPAIMLACAHLAMEQGAKADDTVIVMPIDSYADQAYYDGVAKLDGAVQSGFTDLVLLGVEPTYPSEKYGYIVPSDPEGSPRRVARFTEKPDEATAKALIAQGALWNCGVFAFRLGYLTAISDGYLKAGSFDEFRSRYAELPKNSFDYEVVEKAQSIGVVPYSGTWKDLGTWNTLTEEMADTAAGRVVVDGATCENVHVINETGLPMVVAGLSDAVVVATHDGILACGKEASSGIKGLVGSVAEARPMCERRRWGEYRVLDSSVYPDGKKSLTKELVISAGKQISYQRHAHRTEVWTTVSGEGEVVLDGEVIPVRAGSVMDIEVGRMHAVRATGADLHIIEVQLGDQLVEEDIERFGDFWK